MKQGSNCQIDKSAKISSEVTLGNNVTIYPGVQIHTGAHIWDNCVLGRPPMGVRSNQRNFKNLDFKTTTISEGSVIGCGCVIYRGAKLGSFNIIGDLSVIREDVFFENDVIIGFSSTIQYGVTIKSSSRVLQHSAVSSNAKIGSNNFISCRFTTVSDRTFGKNGYCKDIAVGPIIGDNNKIGPSVTFLSNIRIGTNNIIGAGALITKDILNDGVYFGAPAKRIKNVINS